MSEHWTAERIAELREGCRDRTDVYLGDYVVKSTVFLSLLDELERAREGGWIAVSPETMPKSNVPVIAFYLNSMGKGRRVRAQWAARRSLELAAEADDFDAEYDEDDTPWCPEGWYETNENEDTHWRITETVTHWRPLPAPPVLP